MNSLKEIVRHEGASTATEYALIIAAIAGLLLVSLTALGNQSGTFWGAMAESIDTITR